jgi:hypothetical protein
MATKKGIAGFIHHTLLAHPTDKEASDLPVGATIKVGPGRYEKVVAPTTVKEHTTTWPVAGEKFKTVTVHTDKSDILTTHPWNVEIVD